MNIDTTGPHSFPFFPLPHHQGFCLGSEKVWKWLYSFLGFGVGGVFFVVSPVRLPTARGSRFFPQTPQHLPPGSTTLPEAGGSHSCLHDILQRGPVKVPQWFWLPQSNALETSSATAPVPSVLLLNIQCLHSIRCRELRGYFYEGRFITMSPSSLVLHIKYPLKHSTALHSVNTRAYNIKQKEMRDTHRARTLWRSPGGFLTESKRRCLRSRAAGGAQHRLRLLLPCSPGWCHAGR